jgi:hypothetical protein
MKGGDFMAVDFFEREVHKAQDRFNETFGKLTVCDIRTRQRAILKIIKMSLIRNKIIQEKVKEKLIQERSKFVTTRNWLQDLFNQVENELNERSVYANRPITAGQHSNGAGSVQGASPGM